jgi:hypothetical protein
MEEKEINNMQTASILSSFFRRPSTPEEILDENGLLWVVFAKDIAHIQPF